MRLAVTFLLLVALVALSVEAKKKDEKHNKSHKKSKEVRGKTIDEGFVEKKAKDSSKCFEGSKKCGSKKAAKYLESNQHDEHSVRETREAPKDETTNKRHGPSKSIPVKREAPKQEEHQSGAETLKEEMTPVDDASRNAKERTSAEKSAQDSKTDTAEKTAQDAKISNADEKSDPDAKKSTAEEKTMQDAVGESEAAEENTQKDKPQKQKEKPQKQKENGSQSGRQKREAKKNKGKVIKV